MINKFPGTLYIQLYGSFVAYLTKVDNPNLAKPPFKFNGGLAKLRLTSFVKYATALIGLIQCHASLQKLKRTASSSWQALYCHGLSLVTLMLASLRYNFLQEALDFVGVHQDRMYQVRSG